MTERQYHLWSGLSYPLGATYDGVGTNFALYSSVAAQVELCLFDAEGKQESLPLREVDGSVWHGYLHGVGPGQRYGYRVHGPYDPAAAGVPMTEEDWATGFAKSLAVFLNGEAITERGARGEPIADDSFLLLFNAAEHGVEFTVPEAGYGERWVTVLDTADPRPEPDAGAAKPGDRMVLSDRSMRVMRRG